MHNEKIYIVSRGAELHTANKLSDYINNYRI